MQDFNEGYIDYNKGRLPSGLTPRQKVLDKVIGNPYAKDDGLLNSSESKDRQRGNKMHTVDKRLIGLQRKQDSRNGLRNAKNNIRKFTREEIELLVDYLMSEGYVNNYSSAEKIVFCMSEEWTCEILDEKFVRDISNRPKKGRGRDRRSGQNQRKEEATLEGGYRSKRGERREGRDSARGGFR